MKRSLLTVGLALYSVSANIHAQSADNLVLQGRTFLAAKDLTNANTRFAAAVGQAPNHQTANALYAVTRLLTLVDQPPAQEMLDRLGFSLTNRSIYNWTAVVPRDTNGVPIPPNDFEVMEGVTFVRTNFLPTVSAAIANLDKVTDPNFILGLSSNETSIAQVTLDYADIYLLRSLLHGVEVFGYTINTYNFKVQLNALYNLYSRDQLTAEGLLAAYPLLLSFATTNDFAAAKAAFSIGVDQYLTASELIRNRPTNITRLFNNDPQTTTKEAEFRQTLGEVKQSIDQPVILTLITNGTERLTVHLARYFDGDLALRSLLPNFKGNAIVSGSLPDPSFNGLILGSTRPDIERLLARHFTLLPSFRPVTRFADGHLQLEVNAVEGHSYLIEASENLQTWSPITTAMPTNGILTLSDGAFLQ